MRFSFRRVAFFEDFGRWKIRCYFGVVLGGSWRVFAAFWAILAGFWGFEKESNFETEVGSPKSDFRVKRGEVRGGSGGPSNDR